MDIKCIKIVRVAIHELKELVKLGRETFKESFAWGNTKENMENYLKTYFSEERIKTEVNNPDSEFYFAKLNEEIIGYLKINYANAQTDIKNHESIEIERIYVNSSYQGMRVGQLLCEEAVQIAKEKKKKYIWLGVWEMNPKAIKFYERMGFIRWSQHAFMLGNEQQTDIIMKLDL